MTIMDKQTGGGEDVAKELLKTVNEIRDPDERLLKLVSFLKDEEKGPLVDYVKRIIRGRQKEVT